MNEKDIYVLEIMAKIMNNPIPLLDYLIERDKNKKDAIIKK